MNQLKKIVNKMDIEIIKITSLLITASISLYLAFFKSFITEKGKNLATKKDIGEITAIVGEVKNKFDSNLEYLKNRLNLYSESFHSIKSLERDALIEINKKYSDWLNTLTTFSLAYYNYENFEQLKNLILYSFKNKKIFKSQMTI